MTEGYFGGTSARTCSYLTAALGESDVGAACSQSAHAARPPRISRPVLIRDMAPAALAVALRCRKPSCCSRELRDVAGY